jgi:uncharacterized protein
MPLVNVSKGKTLCPKTRLCTSIFSQARGLMFSRPIHDTCLIFDFGKPRRTDLHMLFVFFPIDILYINDKYCVVDMRAGAMPFTPLIKSTVPSRYIVELPSGKINDTGTRIGDKVRFS